MNRILIFAEQRGGVVHPAAGQLVTAARQIDPAAELSICLIGSDLSGAASSLSQLGVTKVLTVDDPRLERYRPQPYAAALHTAIEKVQPNIVLLLATFMGRDLAPPVAVKSKGALATDCVEVEMNGDALTVQRPVYVGKATAALRLDPGRMKIMSIRPNVFASAEPAGDSAANVEALTLELDAAHDRLVNHECVSTSTGVKDVTEADIVVSGGRSLKNEENFGILHNLAEVLDAAVGASRAACDAGYQPHSRQVGLTGKTVTPKLYMAFGIDGAIQHLAGMRGSKVIVAINTKKEAPIFSVANYGCVADLFEMAPLLAEEFRKVLGR